MGNAVNYYIVDQGHKYALEACDLNGVTRYRITGGNAPVNLPVGTTREEADNHLINADVMGELPEFSSSVLLAVGVSPLNGTKKIISRKASASASVN